MYVISFQNVWCIQIKIYKLVRVDIISRIRKLLILKILFDTNVLNTSFQLYPFDKHLCGKGMDLYVTKEHNQFSIFYLIS